MAYDIVGASAMRPSIRIVVASDGRTLSGSIQMPNGKVLRRDYNLVPLTNAILAKLRQAHERLHGQMSSEEVSGFFSSLFNKAKNLAKKVASSSAVKELYSAAKTYGPEALSALPYGDKAVKVATKIYQKIQEARAGSEEAIAKLREVSEMAKAGHPGAQSAMVMARNIGATLNTKTALQQIAPKATGLLVAAKQGSDDALDKLSRLKSLAENGDPKAIDVMALLSKLNDYLKSSPQEAVSGWRYNVPYRSAMSAVLEKTPGLGLMARSLYYDGSR